MGLLVQLTYAKGPAILYFDYPMGLSKLLTYAKGPAILYFDYPIVTYRRLTREVIILQNVSVKKQLTMISRQVAGIFCTS